MLRCIWPPPKPTNAGLRLLLRARCEGEARRRATPGGLDADCTHTIKHGLELAVFVVDSGIDRKDLNGYVQFRVFQDGPRRTTGRSWSLLTVDEICPMEVQHRSDSYCLTTRLDYNVQNLPTHVVRSFRSLSSRPSQILVVSGLV